MKIDYIKKDMVAPITINIPMKNGVAGFLEATALPGTNILAISNAGNHKNTPAHQATNTKPSMTSAINKPIAIIGIIIFPAGVENQSGASSVLTPLGPGCLAYAPWINPAPRQKIKY